ncbi:MAG TPA: zinc-dependent alcohol dehydrogenase family protein [Azospirillum sp.]|nr:zinc-dependent alcohol dehydrogenase family protein [Azospirillum sp.]
MKAKAAVLRTMGAPAPYADSRPLAVEELDLTPPGDGEVLVRIAAAGLCHSDLSVINGDRPRPLPMALGHEAAGVVEEVGRGVGDLKAGDHVVMVFVPSCGHCQPCMEGRPALCEPAAAANTAGSLISGEWRLHGSGGERINHHVGVSAFAEYAVVSRNSLVKIDASLPLEHAALFGCAVLTGAGAVFNTARVRAGTDVAVVGLGGVGLSALLAAVAVGAARIVAVDLSDAKLETARKLGATHTVNATQDDCAEQVRDLTGGGVDTALEMAGSPRAMDLAFRITRRGGVTVTAGLPNPQLRWPMPLVPLVGEERTVMGSYIGSSVPVRDIPRYVRLFQAGRLPVDKLLSERVRLDGLNAAFDRLARGESIRQVLTF